MIEPILDLYRELEALSKFSFDRETVVAVPDWKLRIIPIVIRLGLLLEKAKNRFESCGRIIVEQRLHSVPPSLGPVTYRSYHELLFSMATSTISVLQNILADKEWEDSGKFREYHLAHVAAFEGVIRHESMYLEQGIPIQREKVIAQKPPAEPPKPKPQPPKPRIHNNYDEIGRQLLRWGIESEESIEAKIKRLSTDEQQKMFQAAILSELQAMTSKLSLLPSLIARAIAKVDKAEEIKLEKQKQKTIAAAQKLADTVPPNVTVIQMTNEEIELAVGNGRVAKRF